VQSQYGGIEQLSLPNDLMIQFTNNVLAALSDKPKYARVDFIIDQKGIAKLMEIELIEPDLFLRHHPVSYGQFVNLLVRCHKK
jgi:hypothetical protein